MKKITLSSIIASATLLPVMVLAQMEGVGVGGYGQPPQSLAALVHAVENIMGLVFGGIAVVMFVIAGILFLTAGGDPEKVKTARDAFIWGVAGVVVGLVAYSIVAIVSSVVT